MKAKNGILILSQTYPPDIGGVETHLSDLTAALENQDRWRVWILSYKPIVTDVTGYRRREQRGPVTIRRFWWFGGNIFRKLEPYPPLMVLYIVPYLLLRSFVYMLPRCRRIDVIHVHGINCALIGIILGTIFRKRIVFQSHALYSFHPQSAFARVTAAILKRMDAILTLCRASRDELAAIGVPSEKMSVYRYWIDLTNFSADKRPVNPQFTAFFAGRLIGIKGEDVVIELAKRFPKARFKIAGGGPEQQRVIDAARQLPNLDYLGLIPNDKLPEYYRAADIQIVPSQYAEGFGRVICEALACGTPVLASNIGGIPDAMDNTVGILCELSVDSFAAALQKLLDEPDTYAKLQANCRPFAERQFSASNAEMIFNAYGLN